jgi:hypothetical protein
MRLHGLAAIGTFLRESRTGTAQPFVWCYLFADHFGSKADRTLINRNVRFVPKADIVWCLKLKHFRASAYIPQQLRPILSTTFLEYWGCRPDLRVGFFGAAAIVLLVFAWTFVH